jgi:ATP synthase F0 subunit b
LSLRGQLEELQGEMQEGIRAVLTEGVPAGVQLMATAVGINAILASSAHAAKGNIFDFGLTLPLQMVQFLLLMVFLEKVVFTPVGKIIDERAAYIRSKSASSSDNTKEVAALNAQAEELLEAARRDAAKKLDAAKKDANAKGAEMMAKAKAEMEASLSSGLDELQKAKEELWAKLEAEVLPALAEDIVSQLMDEAEGEEGSLEAATAGAAE